MFDLVDDVSPDRQIACPGCFVKVGSYSWVGMQCSCSVWEAPAFMIHKRAVDEITVAAPAANPARPVMARPAPRTVG